MMPRRGRRRARVASGAASVAALVVGLLTPGASAASTGRTATATSKEWTVTLWVARTSTRAGTSIPATVTVDNRTGHRVVVSGCRGVVFEMDLGNAKIPNPIAVTTAECSSSMAPGVHVFHTKVLTTYEGCGGNGLPKCGNPPKMSPLPAGTYRTQTVWLGAKPALPTPRPITITLTH